MKKSKLQKRKDNDNSSYWLSIADRLWGEYIHRQYDNKCALCNRTARTDKMEAHHLVTRSVRSLRHDPFNGIILCTLHHKYSTAFSPHMAPLGFAMKLEELYPEKWKWVREHQWTVGRYNYRLAAEHLEMLLYGATGKEAKT